MNEVKPSALTATVVENDIVLEHDGALSLNLPDERDAWNVFLVIDIYDLHNPVHPQGHLGWWRYEIGQLTANPTGRLVHDEGGKVKPVFKCVLPVDEWRNPSEVLANRMELQVVLRSAITNAILSIDRIPVLPSVGDLEAFRSSFDRHYQSPRYAPPHYLLPAHRQVHIVATSIFQRDGVGNLCLGLYRMLRQHQVAVSLFADNFDLAMNDVIDRREMLASRVRADDIIIYFFSIYDGRLHELVGMNCACKIAYFHGITPPKLLQAFDPELSAQCAKAIDQLPLLSRFDRLATNSRASAETLRQALDAGNCASSKRINIIPPNSLVPARLVSSL